MHIPYYIKLEGKENIITFAQSLLDSDIGISDDLKKMYQYAIDNKLHDSIMELITKHCIYDFRKIFRKSQEQEWEIYEWCELILENTILKTPLKQKHFSSYREFYEHIEFIKKHIFINFLISPSTIGLFKSKYPICINDENELNDCLKSFVNDKGRHREDNHYKCYKEIEEMLVFVKYVFENVPNVIVTFYDDYTHDNDDDIDDFDA
jgi:hypothetical protein